jgi:hypothetical protein
MNHEADGLHMGVKDIDAKFDHIDNNARFFPFVENADDYIKVAQRLIDDVDLREKIGATFKNFAAYLTDATRAGSKLDMILRDNLKQTGAL